MKAALSLPCEAHVVTVGSTLAQESQRQKSSLPLVWFWLRNTMGLICLGSCHGHSPTCGSPPPLLMHLSYRGPVCTRRDAEELTAVLEVSRITDTWQVKTVGGNPFSCPEMGSDSQPRRDNSPVPATALLVCNPCCCQPALPWPCLHSVPVSSSAQGESQQARNQPKSSWTQDSASSNVPQLVLVTAQCWSCSQCWDGSHLSWICFKPARKGARIKKQHERSSFGSMESIFCVGNDCAGEQECDLVCVDDTCTSACVSHSFSQSSSPTPGFWPRSPNTFTYLHP